MSISLKPLGSRIIVKPQEQEEITAGGYRTPPIPQKKNPKRVK